MAHSKLALSLPKGPVLAWVGIREPPLRMTQFALRWILMFDAVTCAIPGGKRPDQVAENCKASDLPALSQEVMEKVKEIYEGRVKGLVHGRW